MAKSTKNSPRQRHDPAEIRRLFARRDREGLSMRTLSTMSGIPVGTLSWWSYRLRHGDARDEAGDRPGGRAPFVELIPVENAPCPDSAGEIEVILPNGIRLHVPPGFGAARLARVLTELCRC